MEQSLRDRFHQIRTPRVEERIQDESYTWRFESTLAIGPRNKSDYVSHLGPQRQVHKDRKEETADAHR
jgi:hypothetical protein